MNSGSRQSRETAPPIRFLVVDGLNLVRRVYAAQPGEDSPARAEGAATSSVQSLERALRECDPTHAVGVFEDGGQSWRHRMYEKYKAQRAPMPVALRDELPRLRARFEEVGVRSISKPGVEADDVVATLASKVARIGGSAVILSTDKAFLQLLSRHIRVRDHFGRRELDHAYVVERFGVPPELLVDLLALAGDSTSNIPGIPGIGQKTAARLLGESENLDDVFVSADSIGGRVGELLQRHRDDGLRWRSLLRLQTDLDLGLNLSGLRLARIGPSL